MSAPLSNLQKRDIAQLARRAYAAWPEREAFEAINSDQARTVCFNDWRHVEQGKATGGIQSLCECTQAHWGRLVAHFQTLLGDTAGAQRTLARDQDNGCRIARHKLQQALDERGLATGYAADICRRQYRCTLDQATEQQLWSLLYTVRNRRKPVAAASREQTREPDPF